MYNRFLRTLDQPIQLQPGKAYVVNDRTGEITEVPGVKGIEFVAERVDDAPPFDLTHWFDQLNKWAEAVSVRLNEVGLAYASVFEALFRRARVGLREGMRSREIDAKITDPGQRELAQALWREGASPVEAMSRVYTGKCTADWLVKTGRAELRRRVLEIRGW